MDSYEKWRFHRAWRPLMAYQYVIVCLFDFVAGPAIKLYLKPDIDWNPVTLRNGGLYHVAMGAVLGITSWKRSQEKLKLYNVALEETTNNKVL